MHPALLVDEILRQVFDFCSEHGRATLLSLALSCKAWKDPALDHLWIRLSSLAPLLHLVPGVALVDGVHVSAFFG